jgi:hypothetical protein
MMVGSVALHYAHRTTLILLNDPSRLSCLLLTRGWSAGDPTARGLPRPRVARTQEPQQATLLPSYSFTLLNLLGQLPDRPSLSATFSPAQPRAR